MLSYTIPVVTRLQDNGDGGYTMYCYNSEEEMLADHPLAEKYDSKAKRYVQVELTDDQKNSILTEDDPHENGYLGTNNITVEVNDGVARLVGPLSFHAGQ